MIIMTIMRVRTVVVFLAALIHLCFQVPIDNDGVEDMITNNFRDSCITETNVDPDVLTNPDLTVIESDRNAKCFVRCVMMKSGLLNDFDELQISAIQDAFNLNDTHPLLEQMRRCALIKMDDPCETAYAIHQCGSTVY